MQSLVSLAEEMEEVAHEADQNDIRQWAMRVREAASVVLAVADYLEDQGGDMLREVVGKT